MPKDMKVYRVEIGLVDRKSGDTQNWMSKNVLAKDAPAAIKKVKLCGSEYVVGASVIAIVDQA